MRSNLSDIIDQLDSKRSSLRLSGLNNLTILLTNAYALETINGYVATLTLILQTLLKKGNTSQNIAAMRALTLLALTIGTDNHNLYESSLSPLTTLMKMPSTNAQSKGSAAKCLSMLAFINAEHYETKELLEEFIKLLQSCTVSAPSAVISAVFEAISLLLTTFAPDEASSYMNLLPHIRKHLQSDNLDVRLASGGCFILLYESWQNSELNRLACIAERNSQEFTLEKPEANGEMQEMLELIEKIYSASSRHTGSKSERLSQRTGFRDFIQFIESNKQPTEKMQIGNEKHVFEGFTTLAQLNAIRFYVQRGLSVHLSENHLLIDIFDLRVNPMESQESALEKRMKMKAQSKQKAKKDYLDYKLSRINKQAAREVNFDK